MSIATNDETRLIAVFDILEEMRAMLDADPSAVQRPDSPEGERVRQRLFRKMECRMAVLEGRAGLKQARQIANNSQTLTPNDLNAAEHELLELLRGLATQNAD
jgi:hypothetical protein